jgi:Mg2+-importing ATPase
MVSYLERYVRMPAEAVMAEVDGRPEGLSSREVAARQLKYGSNALVVHEVKVWRILWRQVTGNPLTIILAAATTVSYLTGDHVSSYYIFGMIVLSIVLGFWNDFAAERTVRDLLKRVSVMAVVLRAGVKLEVPVAQVTVGDIVLLAPGSIVAADLRLLEANNLEADQSALTGESVAANKTGDALSKLPADLGGYDNIAFMGTVITSGGGKGVVLAVGRATEFGRIAKTTSFVKPETTFQLGLRKFGDLILRVILVLALVIFAVNALLGHPILGSMMFSLAVAVGLTPELLPVIVTISLARGAGKLAKKHVISKQLIAIENLGNMDVLCTDKTGTLTEGIILVKDALGPDGNAEPSLTRLAIICNSAIFHHKFIGNSIDVAIWTYAQEAGLKLPAGIKKIDEEPFDYDHQTMYTVVEEHGRRQLIMKGSPEAVLAACLPTADTKAALGRIIDLSHQGLRVIALAEKTVDAERAYGWGDLHRMHFAGLITLMDTPKSSAKESLARLEQLGVSIKIITGDSDLVTRHICDEVGLTVQRVILGKDLADLSGRALDDAITHANVFARVTPEQKLLIIQHLQKQGHTVGFLGDGINDAPALRSADVGISVNTAVDVAKDAAPIVLLRKGLDTIAGGIIEGRRTFNNTIKYILMGTSSNFGDMFSMAGASFFLPFLPMLPGQILIENAMYDLSQITISRDNVDEESLLKPQHWNIRFIRNYMIFFGPISSLYDFLTFGILLYVLKADAATFRTGWFVESLATAILVVFVIRTARVPFWKSRPGKWLTVSCLMAVAVGFVLPYSPLAAGLGFVPLPPLYFIILIGLVTTYLGLVGLLKSFFLRRFVL